MAKILFVSVVVGLLAVTGLSYGAELPNELEPETRSPKFAEDTVGLDLHNDFFYYSDDKVNHAFKRGEYTAIKVTLAGQQANLVGQIPKAATNPFAVGQSASTIVGSLMDRWDYKQTTHGYQFFGLFHGVGRPFVVNKVRAQLLRRLANEVQDLLPFLDSAVGQSKSHQDMVKDNIAHSIKSVYAEIDRSITDSMLDNDDSKADATVVIVTDKYVIVVSSRKGRVLGYDSTSLMRDFTGEAAIIAGDMVTGQVKEFGAKKSKSKGLTEPDLAYFEREFLDTDGDEAKLQFLTIQSEPAASSVKIDETKKIIISQVDAHKYRSENEQDLHAGVVTNLLRAAADNTGRAARWMNNIDFSAIFISLERDYTDIH